MIAKLTTPRSGRNGRVASPPDLRLVDPVDPNPVPNDTKDGPRPSAEELVSAALEYRRAGLHVVPFDWQTGPVTEVCGPWKQYAQRMPRESTLRKWMSDPRVSGIACIPQPGHFVLRYIGDGAARASRHWQPELAPGTAIVRTPDGIDVHFFYYEPRIDSRYETGAFEDRELVVGTHQSPWWVPLPPTRGMRGGGYTLERGALNPAETLPPTLLAIWLSRWRVRSPHPDHDGAPEEPKAQATVVEPATPVVAATPATTGDAPAHRELLRDCALAYLEAGFIPLPLGGKNGKIPLEGFEDKFLDAPPSQWTVRGWFRRRGVTGVGLLCRGDYAVRDFDKPEEFKAWYDSVCDGGENVPPGIAVVPTSRGGHVHFRTERENLAHILPANGQWKTLKSEHGGAGELKNGRNSFAVAPPSIRPDKGGFRYKTVAGSLLALQRVDPIALGLVPSPDAYSPAMQGAADPVGQLSLPAEPSRTAEEITEAANAARERLPEWALATIPDGQGMREDCLWRLAEAIAENGGRAYANWPKRMELCLDWYRAALPNIGTKELWATEAAFRRAVNNYDPSRAGLGWAIRRALKAEPIDELPAEQDFGTVVLAKVCRELARLGERREFFLACSSHKAFAAHGITELKNRGQVWSKLENLGNGEKGGKGAILLVKKGYRKPNKRKGESDPASIYLWTWPIDDVAFEEDVERSPEAVRLEIRDGLNLEDPLAE